MRSALIPSRGDPITLRLVFHYFETVWQDEVDKLYINVNSPCEKPVIDFIEKFTKHPKVVFSYDDHSLDHGGSLTKMFHQGEEEYIAFMEDDSLVYKKGEVDKHFKFLENNQYDAIGVLRWSCTGEMIDRGRTMFNLWDPKYQAGGWFWPCFYFGKRSDIAKSDLNFCGKKWKAGEIIDGLGWQLPVDIDSDTFVNFSIQMRALGLCFLEIPTPCDVTDPGFGWVHTTSLSSPMDYILTDEEDVPLSLRHGKSAHKFLPQISDTYELEKKFAWMKTCLEKFDYSEIKDFSDAYAGAIEKAISRFNMNRTNITNYVNSYKNALGL
jgi:hypothetical protein